MRIEYIYNGRDCADDLTRYITNELTDASGGELERTQERVEKCARAIANLLELLYSKGLCDKIELAEIIQSYDIIKSITP